MYVCICMCVCVCVDGQICVILSVDVEMEYKNRTAKTIKIRWFCSKMAKCMNVRYTFQILIR